MNYYKKRAINHYGEKCQACGETEGIEVHHIDGDRDNNRVGNLIPLCRKCHEKVTRESGYFNEKNFLEPIESSNPLLVWLIRTRRITRAKEKIESGEGTNGCANPFCRDRPTDMSENGKFCWEPCRERYIEFKETVENIEPTAFEVNV